MFEVDLDRESEALEELVRQARLAGWEVERIDSKPEYRGSKTLDGLETILTIRTDFAADAETATVRVEMYTQDSYP